MSEEKNEAENSKTAPEIGNVKEEITPPAGVTEPPKTPALPSAELPTIEQLKKEAEGVLNTASGLAAAIILGEVDKHNAEAAEKRSAEQAANIAFPPTYETREEERRLEVVLSELDKEKLRKEVLSLLKKKQQNESAIKRLNDHYKGEIKNDSNKIQELMELVEAGKEFRAVKCLQLRDFNKRAVTVFRLDSDTVVENRGLKEEELPRLKQVDLPFNGSKPSTVEEAVTRVKDAKEALSLSMQGGEKSAAESHSNPAPAPLSESASSGEIQASLEYVEREIAITAKQQEAEPTPGLALRLVELDKEAIGLRVELREALRGEQEASKQKKKAEKTSEKTSEKTPKGSNVKKENTKPSKAGGDDLITCGPVAGHMVFFLNGKEENSIEVRKHASTLLVEFLVKQEGSAAKLLDRLTPYPTTFSKRTVQRYAAGETVVSDDFLRGLAECIPAEVLKQFSRKRSELTLLKPV